jgi:uncharacterized protein
MNAFEVKPKRIRDPLHDLIEFDTSDFEQLMWRLINTQEFQRLRRIRQLGFSEFVYPGATHTRFAHSVGVFHTSRQLVGLVKRKLEAQGQQFSLDRAQVAMCAALVHDVGHGPFSHAFETATKALKAPRNHEDWSSEIIRSDTTELGCELAKYEADKNLPGFRDAVADTVVRQYPRDIYDSIVSSQFDADRLDYIRRDRLMTGTKQGNFDISWLFSNLEIRKVWLAAEGTPSVEVDMFVAARKALPAIESYVLGLFHQYEAIAFHKVTRSAECMLVALITQLGLLLNSLSKKEFTKATALGMNDPLVAFIAEILPGQKRQPHLETYLKIDDSVLWMSINLMRQERAENVQLRELADGLCKRKLYKVIDLSREFGSTRLAGAGKEIQFIEALRMRISSGSVGVTDVLIDVPKRDPYKLIDSNRPEAMKAIYIRDESGRSNFDIVEKSEVVRSLKEKRWFRVCVRNEQARQSVQQILTEMGL